jgi:hypothetical protein
MASQSERLPLGVTVGSPKTFQEELEAAVAIAQADAVQQGQCGVLITRHSYTHFTVDMSEDVPFGTTAERQAWDEPAV